MKKDQPTKPEDVKPEDVISGIVSTRRDLVRGVRVVVAGSGFSVEEADLLVSLYGARELDWPDLEHDKDGFVTFTHLEHFLVYSGSLLSRRIGELAKAKLKLVEVRKIDRKAGQHFNAKEVRITNEGSKGIKPVWDDYCAMSAELVKDISESDLKVHLKVNEAISKEMKKWLALRR